MKTGLQKKLIVGDGRFKRRKRQGNYVMCGIGGTPDAQ